MALTLRERIWFATQCPDNGFKEIRFRVFVELRRGHENLLQACSDEEVLEHNALGMTAEEFCTETPQGKAMRAQAMAKLEEKLKTRVAEHEEIAQMLQTEEQELAHAE